MRSKDPFMHALMGLHIALRFARSAQRRATLPLFSR